MHHFTALPAADAAADPSASDHAAAIKRWTRQLLGLEEDVAITVTEFACADPGCPLLETAITVFEQGRTRCWKFTRPRMAVTRLMVQQTLQSPPIA